MFLLVLLAALVFEYINGFHDTANAIATVVSTKVLAPRRPSPGRPCWNLHRRPRRHRRRQDDQQRAWSTPTSVNMLTVFCALVGAILWNLLTWWLGLPSSSSHALIGGLCGAALATANGNWNVLHLGPPVDKGRRDGPLAQGRDADVHLAAARIHRRRRCSCWLLMIILRAVTPRMVNADLRQGAAPQRGLHGLRSRLKRCAKDDGHHHARAVHRHDLGRIQGFARMGLPSSA
jgi:PiT family inorganic phosphate transporter